MFPNLLGYFQLFGNCVAFSVCLTNFPGILKNEVNSFKRAATRKRDKGRGEGGGEKDKTNI